MCDLTEVDYLPGQVVWVKLGSCWWPGEVKDIESLPEDMVRDFKKKPLAIVKFFGEDSYEYVKNLDNIYHYNNRRKMEFIKKGMDLYRSKSKQGQTLMDKFPTDVVTAETLSGGNINILKSTAFVPEEKVDYKELFESPKKKAKKSVEKPGPSKAAASTPKSSGMAKANHLIQIKQRITHPRFVKESDHEIRIRQQPVAQNDDKISHAYKCQECEFGTNRQNLFIMHCKAHRDQEKTGGGGAVSKAPKVSTSSKTTKTSAVAKQTPAPKVKKAPTPRTSTAKVAAAAASPKSSPPKVKRNRSEAKEAAEAARKIFQTPKKGRKGTPKAKFPPKTEEELAKEQEKRNKILADWDEDEQEEELEIKKMKLDTAADSTSAQGEEEEMETLEQEEKNTPKEADKEGQVKDAGSVYDIIEEPEAIAPPPTREVKEDKESSKEKEKLNKEINDLLMETAMPNLPDLPSLPNIPGKKSDSEQSYKKEELLPDTAKTNGEVTATTEEAVTVTPSGDSSNDPNTETATYVLVTVDEGGFHQLSDLENMAGTTLYIDPAQLTGSGTSLDNLYLAIDEGGLAQLDQQQVSLQMGTEVSKTTQQDILATALANTQVLQTTAGDVVGVPISKASEALVKVTNTTQAPVMTSRVAESSLTSSVNNGSAGNSAS